MSVRKILFIVGLLADYCLPLAAQERPVKDHPGDDSFFLCDIDKEKSAVYKGGAVAWTRFLNENFRYPDEDTADRKGCYTVTIRFRIDTVGNISQIKVINGAEFPQKEVVRVIERSSGNWEPAMAHDKKVSDYKILPFEITILPE